MNQTKAILTYFILALILGACKKNEQTYSAATETTTHLIDSFVTANKIPGLSITVTVNKKNIYSRGFGYADIEQKVKVNPSKTRFRIASISKAITSDALVQLEKSGKLHLDSVIQHYLPTFPKKKGRVTPRLLAGHLAGIRTYRGDEFFSRKHYNSVQDAIKIFSDDTLISYPGKEYHYSSFGWNLLSAIIEKAANEKFLSYMQKNVFNPLKMENTCADLNDSIISFRSRFYSFDEKGKIINSPYVDNSCKWAGGGFISTSEDITKFAIAHMNEGYLSQKQINKLITPLKKNSGETTHYGLGWSNGTDNFKHKFYGHSGGAVGGTSQMVIYPKEKVTVVILCNKDGVKYNGIQNKIANLFIKIY